MTPIAGWKAGLVILGSIIGLALLVNALGLRFLPKPAHPKPAPAITGTPATPHKGPVNENGGLQ